MITVSVICAFLLVMPVFADYDASVIQQVQQALNDAGFDCGTPDGVAGNMTAEAVRAFQEANGLTADGQISDELIQALGLASSADGNDGNAAVPADTEEQAGEASNDSLFDISKFDETMYEGSWYTIERGSVPDLAYEIYIPAEWTPEPATSVTGTPAVKFTLPEEFSQAEFEIDELASPEQLNAAGGEALASFTAAAEKISINDIDADIYYIGMYDPNPDSFTYKGYTDMITVLDEAGLFSIGISSSTLDDPLNVEEMEAFMPVAKNVLNSLRMA